MARVQSGQRVSVRLAMFFPVLTRQKGLEYFLSRRVRLQNGSKDYVEALVQGSRQYDVSLDVQGDELFCECDCPLRTLCKHIWATVLQAEAQGHLADAVMVDSVHFGYDDASKGSRPAPATPLGPPEPPSRWRFELNGIREQNSRRERRQPWPDGRELLYVIELSEPRIRTAALLLAVLTRDPRKTGQGWNKTKELKISRSDIAGIKDASDRAVLALLAGSRALPYVTYYPGEALPSTFELHLPLTETLLPLLFATGRVFSRTNRYVEAPLTPVAADSGDHWRFELSVSKAGQGGYELDGTLVRNAETQPVSAVQLVTDAGDLMVGNRLGRIANPEAVGWLRHLWATGPVRAPEKEGNALLAFLLAESGGIPVRVPEELEYQRIEVTPTPCLTVQQPRGGKTRDAQERLPAKLRFLYADWFVSGATSGSAYNEERRVLIVRNTEAEQSAEAELQRLGLRFDETASHWWLLRQRLASVLTTLIAEGWQVDVDGNPFRQSTGSRMEVTSGIDWFDLSGEVAYGEASAEMPALLEAIRRGESVVRLTDGSYGLVPEEWLARLSKFALMGETGREAVRFSRVQTGLLDALLAADDTIRFDQGFAHAREQLRRFEGIAPANQPETFCGTLREYQREGLGWLEFLQSFGWGGCLADDMGLGKTAQVLALLERRRMLRRGEDATPGERPQGPSLVVVPKSLIFNWKAEAARFTPAMRLTDYTGAGRNRAALTESDVVLTTYGTLRRDVTALRETEFDYIVLDEAQAIKNAGSDSAKAVRLLRGRHRLAMSGTPVENHLGELWSLFEFLNPGMLGTASAFGGAGKGGRDLDEAGRRLLARALRPFILRRTKKQVASELPERTEQTLWCELDQSSRSLYDELRQHYRASLLGRIEKHGLNKSKMHVLEALLRLRQAACHPGLLDPARADEPGAKLDLLLEQLTEVTEEGHKALVFSQFTSLLSLVKKRLAAAGIVYEYLDGSTNDRQARVERFQQDEGCPVFLISLKAGGLGLNLTAAEYVYMLDPWWNPAVEAQAIDRAHRIGQTRPVFAYRLIARDTVEEKVLELQRSKRDLAAAIIAEDNSVVRDLRREDLEMLLS